MDFRARFAPSPTGQVHIGNIRTAIFNYLYTRHSGGEFLLRIEDTDLERSTQQAIDTLLDCMKWLGLDYDGEIMYQTRQASKHMAAAAKLEAEGNAYRADPATNAFPLYFRIPYHCSDFTFVRDAGRGETLLAPETDVVVSRAGVQYYTLSAKGKACENQGCLAGFYNLNVLDSAGNVLFALDDSNVNDILSNVTGITVSGAAKLVFDRREVFYNDIVKKLLAKPLDSMKDFIIVRSDGSPVFHLANVWDDIDQKVTHIVRGDDHVENTYRHLFMFRTLGFEPPVYAHLPMIVNAQGKPYSKRDGDAFVGDFKDKGILPQALFNYLSLLGWSPGDNREKMTMKELVEAFQLEKAQHSPAQFDMNKLLNMNGMYIAEMDSDLFVSTAFDYAVRRGAVSSDVCASLFREAALLMQSRTKVFTDVDSWKYFFTDQFELDAKGVRKLLKDTTVRKALLVLADALGTMADCSCSAVENLLRNTESEFELKEFALNQPFRLCATGLTVGAGMYETAVLIGCAECAGRIRSALENNPI